MPKDKEEKKEQKQLEPPTLIESLAAALKDINGRLNTIETRLANQDIKLTQIQEGIEALRADHTTIMQTQESPSSDEVEPLEWNPYKINWEQAEGRSGPYERSEDTNNLEFKTMLQELGRCDGKLTRDGMFYWTFQNGVTVGRKKSQYPKK